MFRLSPDFQPDGAKANRATTFLIVLMVALSSVLIGACSKEQSSEEHIETGKAHLGTGDWLKALAEFQNAVKKDPKSARARAVLGRMYYQVKDAGGAAKEMSKAIRLGYDQADLNLPLGLAYQKTGKFREIVDEVHPDDRLEAMENATIYAIRAQAYIELDDRKAAHAMLERAREMSEEPTLVRTTWALYERLAGNLDAEELWLRPLLEREGIMVEAWSQLGDIEQKRGNLDAAEAAYSRAIEVRGRPHEDYVKRAMIRVSKNDLEGAETDIEYLKRMRLNLPQMAYVDGLIDFHRQRYPEAQVHFLGVLARIPGYAEAQLMAAMSYFHQGMYQSANSLFDSYFRQGKGNFEAKKAYAKSLIEVAKPELARPLLEKMERERPDDIEVLKLLVEAYDGTGSEPQKIDTLRKLVKASPDDAHARMQLGRSLIRNPATLAAAQLELRKSLELDPGLFRAKEALTYSYLAQNQYQEALTHALDIQRGYPDWTLGPVIVARIYLAQDRDEEAVEVLRIALEKFPGDLLASHNLARIFLRNGAVDEARAVYAGLLDRHPGEMRSLEKMALLAVRAGNLEEHDSWLQQSVRLNPESSWPRLLLASDRIFRGQPEEAARLLREVELESKSDDDFMLLMSWIKLATGQTEHALQILKRLTKREPENILRNWLLAEVYAAQDGRRKLRAALESIVRADSNHLAAQLRLARLDHLEGRQRGLEDRLTRLRGYYAGLPEIAYLEEYARTGDRVFEFPAKQPLGALGQATPADLLTELAATLWRQGRRQEITSALELWSESLADTRFKALLAKHYLLEDRYSDARTTYLKIEAEAPDDPRVYNDLAKTLLEVDPARGFEYARRAERINRGSPFILETMATALLRAGRTKEALKVIQGAVARAPANPALNMKLAEILAANNQSTKAREVLESTLGLTEDVALRIKINERLDRL